MTGAERACRVAAILLGLGASACDAPPGAADAQPGADAGADDAADDAALDAGWRPSRVGPAERPARLFVPPAYDGRAALPLVLLLHGYTVDATMQDLYFGMTRAARSGGFYLLLPDGTFDADGERHWDVAGRVVDDHAYLRGIVLETASLVPVARGEIYAIGHSNGAFMAYRLACDSADLFAGIASLAGAEATACAPARAVSVLEMHGTADDTVSYAGGSIAGLDYPAAATVVERWAERAGCDTAAPEELSPIDLVPAIAGAETRVTAYRSGCAGATAELWSIEGGEHIPALAADFAPRVVVWLRAHAR